MGVGIGYLNQIVTPLSEVRPTPIKGCIGFMTDTAIRPKNVSVSLWEQRLLAIVEPPPADILSLVEKRAPRTAAHAGAADVAM